MIEFHRKLWVQRSAIMMIAIVIMLSSSSCTSLIKSKDHRQGHWENSHANAYLWRRVKNDPAIFYPAKLPKGYKVTPATGNWVVDPQDRAAFFVPNKTCADLSPRIWHSEAVKAVNRLSKGQQAAYNTTTVVVGWPAFIALVGAYGLYGGAP